MKKTILLVIVLFISAGVLTAQDSVPKFLTPVDPTILGRGNTAIADPGGYQSFFHNPAGFTLDNQLTVLNLNGWLFTDKNTINLIRDPESAEQNIEDILNDPGTQTAVDDWIAEQSYAELREVLIEAGVFDGSETELQAYEWFTSGGELTAEEYMQVAAVLLERGDFPFNADDLGLPKGAARAGLSAGVAWTGHGIGIGLFTLVDAELYGANIFAASGIANLQATLHIGYAHTFDLGILKLHAGAQLRPTIVYQAVVGPEFLNSLMSGGGDVFAQLTSQPGIAGFGVGLDAGVIAEIWWFKAGISAMNLLSVMNWNDGVTLEDIANDFGVMLPTENQLTDPETTIALNFGLAFNPKIPVITDLLNPTLYVDFQDINGIIKAYEDGDEEAMLDLVNIGLDVQIIKIIKASVGYSSGYFTAGLGIDLPVVKINVAGTVGTIDADDVSDFGLAANIAIRF